MQLRSGNCLHPSPKSCSWSTASPHALSAQPLEMRQGPGFLTFSGCEIRAARHTGELPGHFGTRIPEGKKKKNQQNVGGARGTDMGRPKGHRLSSPGGTHHPSPHAAPAQPSGTDPGQPGAASPPPLPPPYQGLERPSALEGVSLFLPGLPWPFAVPPSPIWANSALPVLCFSGLLMLLSFLLLLLLRPCTP